MKPINPLVLLVILTFSLTITNLSAQSTISADRPGFGVSSATLLKGHGQVETGFQVGRYIYEGHPAYSPIIFTDWSNYTTFRFGITNWLEIKTDLNPGISYMEGAHRNHQTFFAAPTIGTRIKLFQSEKGGSGLLYGTVNLPFLASDPQPPAPTGDFRFLYAKSICENWTLDVNLGTLIDLGFRPVFPEEEKHSTRGQYSVAGTWMVFSGWSFFAEYFGISDLQTAEGWADGGVIFNPSNRTQVDLSGGFLLHQPKETEYLTSVWFLTTGFAWRFPN